MERIEDNLAFPTVKFPNVFRKNCSFLTVIDLPNLMYGYYRSAESTLHIPSARKERTTTLTGLHFVTTILMTVVLRWLGYIQTSHLPFTELLKFILFANFSIVEMNVSLMWNSVGFYQIAKLTMIPVSCLLEVVFDKIQYSRDTKLSISVVLLGVAVCTVTDVSVNANGFITAFIAVWSTSLQQYYVYFLQRKYSLNSFNLLGHTAPVQVASLLLLDPIMDYWLTNKRIESFDFTLPSVSSFTSIFDYSASVHSHLVYNCRGNKPQSVHLHRQIHCCFFSGPLPHEDYPCSDSWILIFWEEGLSIQVVIGMIIAVMGMIWYDNASSKPGCKERCIHSLP
ncbi:hypothetical protein ACS0TY_025195 [Phlomoides rotata]